MGITVSNEIREYPDEDKPYETLRIRNHWNRPDRVVLILHGREYVFLAEDLRRAIANAINFK